MGIGFRGSSVGVSPERQILAAVVNMEHTDALRMMHPVYVLSCLSSCPTCFGCKANLHFALFFSASVRLSDGAGGGGGEVGFENHAGHSRWATLNLSPL